MPLRRLDYSSRGSGDFDPMMARLQVSSGANTKELWPQTNAAAVIIQLPRMYQGKVSAKYALSLRCAVSYVVCRQSPVLQFKP